jgi:antitoxin (DNA-binding transcriptional repressor) of toxin-antitoxin stability system
MRFALSSKIIVTDEAHADDRLVQAKQRLPDLVKRASEGESIGLTRRGKLVAILVPPRSDIALDLIFADIEQIRKRAKPLNGLTIKDLIEEGRR